MTRYKDYGLDLIDDVAKEVIQTLAETGTHKDLARVALCRSLVMLSKSDELDDACRMIDDLSEVPSDTIDYEEE